MVGVVQSNILFSAITSTVDTIMICFAGSPDIFERRYPFKCMVFRSAWKTAWPGTIDYVNGETRAKRKSLNGIMGTTLRSQNGHAHLLGSSRSNLDEIFV